jgi:hypothetical protein
MTRDAHRVKVQEGRDDMPIFIHSELDDYGLSLIEFRVYARLARRCGKAAASESVPNMARDFGVSDRTVQRALRLLVAARLIAEERRPGKTTLYTLLPRPAWAPALSLPALRTEDKAGEVVTPETGVVAGVVTSQPGVSGDTTEGGQKPGGDTGDRGVVTPQRGVGVTPETDEGSPLGSPPKVLPTHTHAVLPGTGPDGADANGVCVSRTRYSPDQRKAYALAHPLSLDKPDRWVWSKRTCAGEFDEAIAAWYAAGKPVEGSAATAKPADTSACPDCHGDGHYFTDPTDPKTHRVCKHPRLAEGLADLQREYEQARSQLDSTPQTDPGLQSPERQVEMRRA